MDISYMDKIEWTHEKVLELEKCMLDPIYFAEKYFLIREWFTGDMKPIKLHWYQKEILNRMIYNKMNAISVARQNGKTTLCCIAALWLALFHSDYSIGILSAKEAMSRQSNKIIRDAFELLPDYLKVPTERFNLNYIKMSNGSTIHTDTMRCDAVRGKTMHYVYLDDFGYTDEEKADDFFKSVIPVLSSIPKSHLSVISTPSTKKHTFFKLFDKAEKGAFDWAAGRYPWSVNPHRKQEWRDNMKSIVGQESWETEFELQFSDK
jgi:hypothetical protein